MPGEHTHPPNVYAHLKAWRVRASSASSPGRMSARRSFFLVTSTLANQSFLSLLRWIDLLELIIVQQMENARHSVTFARIRANARNFFYFNNIAVSWLVENLEEKTGNA